MNNKFKLKPLAIAMLPILIGSSTSLVQAQETQKDQVEVIEVTGFKGSLLRSLNNKRSSDAISDSVFSEDIGKSADQDIGEALQRITGVSIQRGGGVGDGGDSTTVSVRGASPDLNVISLNGVTLTSSSENQTVDLSAFSSDILNSIEVLKTATADQNEGSLGASVILKTFRPLDASENKRVVEFQGRHSDFADEQDYKLSGSFSEKFLDDTLGFYVTAFKETQAYRQDRFFANGYKTQTFDDALNKNTGQPMGGPTTGLINDQNGYSLSTNQLEREGFTTAIQWLPTEETEVLLDITMSDQYVAYDEATFTIIGPNDKYLPEDPIATGDDPWVVYNPDNQLFEKVLNRYSRGRIAQLENGIETTNRVYSIDVNHYFTDNFSMKFRAGYSKTVADDDYYTYINTNNFAHVSDAQTEGLAVGVVEPVGYDCTSGICLARFGSGIVGYGPDIDGVPQTGAPDEDPLDNTSTTMFNPDDLNALHLQQVNTRDRDLSDKQKQVFLDFDYETNWGPVTKIEFGAKYQKRNKDVFNQNNFFENADDAWVPDGQSSPSLGAGVASIRLDQVTKGQTKHGDDFLDILGYPRDNATDGWYTIDGQKALDLLFTTPDVRRRPDLSNDRQVELENKALYFKMNFSLLDDDLTGNFGIRYVESSVDSIGYSGVKHKTGPFASDYKLLQIAADSSLAPCTAAQLYNNGVDYNPDANDIEGANLAGALDENGNWGPAPGQSCYDADWNSTPLARSRYWYAPGLGENPAQYQATGSNTYDNWLPSLSLNYQLNDETVLRAAASTTMARPRIDSLKPSYTLNQNLWGGGDSNGTINNPNLIALESNNFDLSYEWYFNDGGALSAAIFYKDMTNFEEIATRSEHWIDLRGYTTEQLEALDPLGEALIQPKDDGSPKTVFEEPNCMPNFRHRWESNAIDLVTQCDIINVNVIRNGKGASIQGLELGYNQNYDFLPGILSGLGVSANYTYSDSKTEAEIIGFDTQLSSLPLENVSKHQYNLSTFWEKDGNLIRLAYNHRSDSLSRRSYRNGAIWNDGGGSLDLSATYKINETFTLTFNAVNLNERIYRQYYTNLVDATFELEGNALEGEANKSRTVREWASGATYRLAIRATF
ncbi:TonB-dependent receptor [Paraglaciecola sp. L3A3]|uniref:TonB-dependent receptor n=1 Tax=Paraglaciecola sp. L3A3 TaxID=2686358 RepID=UPI00131B571A|nr:TonB-dependent receptor [Paraglaciecola sp. L3A3]